MSDLSVALQLSFQAALMRLIGWLPWLLLLALLLALYWLPRHRRVRARRRLIHRLEASRGSRVIAMIHREGGPLSLMGGGSIGNYEAETILKIIRETPPTTPIDLLLHTPGGRIYATAQIGRALKNHPAPVRAIVPHWAMSGGTFLSLAADEILMDKNAILGPVDPQTFSPLKGAVAMASALRVIREKSKDEIDDETWMLADQAEKMIHEVEQHLYEVMLNRLGEEKARELARTMSEGRWTHAYPFTAQELSAMGLKVSTEVPKEAYELLEAFPSGARFRAIQWLPAKKKGKAEAEQEGIGLWPGSETPR